MKDFPDVSARYKGQSWDNVLKLKLLIPLKIMVFSWPVLGVLDNSKNKDEK